MNLITNGNWPFPNFDYAIILVIRERMHYAESKQLNTENVLFLLKSNSGKCAWEVRI